MPARRRASAPKRRAVAAIAAAAGIGLALAAVASYRWMSSGDYPTAPLTETPDGRGLTLVFADEFDTFSRWDGQAGRWKTFFAHGPSTSFGARTLQNNGEEQLYVDPDFAGPDGPLGLDPFSVRDGVLHITATRAPEHLAPHLGGFKYLSGLITSQPSFSQTYGYFEMRAKLVRGQGLWPAFWLLPSDTSWPPEIDVMESVGDPTEAYVTLHSNFVKIDGKKHRISGKGFHTFAVAWDPDNVTWFINGKRVLREQTPADMHKPMYMLANLAVGGGWPGPADETTPLPISYQIDFIRAYRLVN